MKYLKKVLKTVGIMLGILLLLTLIITMFNYWNLINNKVVNIMEIIIPILTLFIGGFIIGKSSNQKGWLEGIKIGIIFLIILVLFNYLGLQNKLEWKSLIYYLILIISSVFGSMFGISLSDQKEKR